ncbi:MAG: hypothetical protein IKN12_05625 [Selenomonadaceae bacterium]|nr:hypothetical protein [Selenomonadaceae bacterium]
MAGTARRGLTRYGMDGCGQAWQGKAGLAGRGLARQDKVWHGTAGDLWHGKVKLGMARLGLAR